MALFAAHFVEASAKGATISSIADFIAPASSTGSAGPVSSVSPNNDNTASTSANSIPYSITLGIVGSVETQFALENSGGTTEYSITQTIVNNTAVPWIGFVFELGFGTGGNFQVSGSSDELDFDWPTQDPAFTSTVFATLVPGAETLTWSGGPVPVSGTVVFTLAVDVPDNLQAVNPGGTNHFVLRETPIAAATAVPEPATATAIGICLTVLAIVARRRV